MKTRKNFWIGLGLLLVEVAFFIFLMVWVSPLKEILPVYFILILIMLGTSIFLLKKARGLESESPIKAFLFAFTSGMIWWTTTEMNAEAFRGSGIEDNGGFILLLLGITILITCWKDINKIGKIAIATFVTNWGSHMIIKMLLHMRNPADPTLCLDPMNAFNLIGFIYGFVSIVGIILIVIKVFRKGLDVDKAPYYALGMYALLLNLLYIFVKGLFPIV